MSAELHNKISALETKVKELESYCDKLILIVDRHNEGIAEFKHKMKSSKKKE